MNKVGKVLTVVGATVVAFGCGVLYHKKKEYDKKEKEIFLSSNIATIDDIFVNSTTMMDCMQSTMWHRVKEHVFDFRLGYELIFTGVDPENNNNKFYATSSDGNYYFEFTWSEKTDRFDYVMSPLPGAGRRWLEYFVNCYLS